MITLTIAIAFSILLFSLGCAWSEIAIALIIVLAFSYGSIAMHAHVEQQTQRRIAPRSEKYFAAYFGVSIGITLVANYIFQDSHFLVSTAVVFSGIIIAEMTAHIYFGEPIAPKDAN